MTYNRMSLQELAREALSLAGADQGSLNLELVVILQYIRQKATKLEAAVTTIQYEVAGPPSRRGG